MYTKVREKHTDIIFLYKYITADYRLTTHFYSAVK